MLSSPPWPRCIGDQIQLSFQGRLSSGTRRLRGLIVGIHCRNSGLFNIINKLIHAYQIQVARGRSGLQRRFSRDWLTKCRDSVHWHASRQLHPVDSDHRTGAGNACQQRREHVLEGDRESRVTADGVEPPAEHLACVVCELWMAA